MYRGGGFRVKRALSKQKPGTLQTPQPASIPRTHNPVFLTSKPAQSVQPLINQDIKDINVCGQEIANSQGTSNTVNNRVSHRQSSIYSNEREKPGVVVLLSPGTTRCVNDATLSPVTGTVCLSRNDRRSQQYAGEYSITDDKAQAGQDGNQEREQKADANALETKTVTKASDLGQKNDDANRRSKSSAA